MQYWVSVMLAVYAAGLLAFSPIWGYMADQTSSRGVPFLMGLVALVLATALLMVGSSVAVIVVGRLLQGASAALVWTVGLAIVSDTVGPEHLGEAMGWVSLGMGFGVFSGPLLGGIVFAKGGYYAVFAMAFGCIGVDIILRLFMIETKVAAKYALPESSPESGTEPRDRSPRTASSHPGPAAGTEPVRRKKQMPSLLILLKSPRLLSASWGCLVQAALLSAFDSVLPLYVHGTFGWDSLGAGLIFLPICIPSFFEPIIGKLSDRYGIRIMAVCGFLGALPFFVLLRFVYFNSLGQKVLLCALLLLIGVAVCIVMPPLLAEITRIVVEKEEQDPDVFGSKSAIAQAYALLNMAYAAGSIVGPIWGGFVERQAGWGTMAWTLGLLSAVTAVPTFFWAGGPLRKKEKDEFRRENIHVNTEEG